MTDAGGLQQSVAAMGLLELALALGALTCYALVLNGSLSMRARAVALGCATLAAAFLVARTDPWTNGVILVALGVGGVGVFVVTVWGISLACGLTGRRVRERIVLEELAPSAATPTSARARPTTHAHSV